MTKYQDIDAIDYGPAGPRHEGSIALAVAWIAGPHDFDRKLWPMLEIGFALDMEEALLAAYRAGQVSGCEMREDEAREFLSSCIAVGSVKAEAGAVEVKKQAIGSSQR